MEKPTDYSELLRRAQSPAGMKLLSLLQQSGGNELEAAMEKASQGDFSHARKQLAVLLDTPEAKKLLNEPGRDQMSELEEKLSSILGNPQMMQQIMSLAQTMGGGQSEQPRPPEPAPIPNVDPAMLKNLAGMASKGSVDPNQQALLTALSPYLSRDRVSKLERAMQAARLAGAASAFLGSGSLQKLSGR